MSIASEIAEPPVSGTLQQFNRYGLPGLVIGVQFVIIIGLIYVLIYTLVPALQASTKAMTEVTEAVGRLTETIKDRR